MEKNTGKKIGIAVGVLGIGLLVSHFLLLVSFHNQEKRLRAQIVAQQVVNTAVFDNTWKVLSQQAQVSEQYRDAFAEIYPALMEGRYDQDVNGGGALMSLIVESNPSFDTSLYGKLSQSIEVQRATFTQSQKILVDLGREHDTLRSVWPSSWYLSGVEAIPLTVVTSRRTQNVFQGGIDENVDLFDSDK